MCALHRGQEVSFGDFLSRTFHHEELATETSIEKVEIGLSAFVVAGVDHPFAIDATDANATNRAHEGHVGEVKCRRGGVHGQDVGFVLTVAADQHGVDLHVVVVTVREERTNRTVAHTSDQRFLFGGTLFALEETAREAACGIKLFAIFTLKREEVNPFTRFIRARDGTKNGGITHGYGYGTGGLLSQETGFDGHGLSGDFGREFLTVLHTFFLLRVVARKELLPPCPQVCFVLMSFQYQSITQKPHRLQCFIIGMTRF